MKRRVLKKQMRRFLNRELPTMFKLFRELPTMYKQLAIYKLIKASHKSSWFQFKDLPYVRFDRFSTTLHKGVITVSEHDKVDEIGFSSWRQALIWVCKQAKRVDEYEVQGSEYVVDSGHYRYRTHFPKEQE